LKSVQKVAAKVRLGANILDKKTEGEPEEVKVDLNSKIKVESKCCFKWVIKDTDRFDR
jgi:hypothetical protein